MNDEETVALIAGGHTFGKTHGAAPGDRTSAANRRAATSRSRASAGRAATKPAAAPTPSRSGLEVTWTTTPTKWSNDFFKHLFEYEWELTTSPAGAKQWKPKNGAGEGTVPNAHDKSKKIAPVDADDRPRAAVRPGLREDLAALPREPAGVRGRVREGVVQADAPRHGADLALPGPAGSEGAAAVAGPGPDGHSRTDRREGHRRPQGEDPRLGTVDLRSWSRPPGRRRRRSAAPTSAAAPTARASASRRRRIGRSTIRPSWRRC